MREWRPVLHLGRQVNPADSAAAVVARTDAFIKLFFTVRIDNVTVRKSNATRHTAVKIAA